MLEFVKRFVTPLSLSHAHGRGQAHGTGNYVQLLGQTFILTNQHVAVGEKGASLGHLPQPGADYVKCDEDVLMKPYPYDVGLISLKSHFNPGNREILPASKFCRRFHPVNGELFFWLGYPGHKATSLDSASDNNLRYNWFGGTLDAVGYPVITQHSPCEPGEILFFDKEKHIALHYPSMATRNAGEPDVVSLNPKGMSGSLLWDTRYVACLQSGEEWRVEKARVCGLLNAAHTNPAVVVATKIEYVRRTILSLFSSRMLRHKSDLA
jgi:hypothetical protein